MSSIQNFSKELAAALASYSKEVTEGLEDAKTNAAKDVVKYLRANSPKQTGAYAKGWRITKVGNAQVIHNKTRYQLTHLLEHGHVKAKGGRVGARIHIAPAEQQGIEKFVSDVEKVIKR
ncbi:hypothetical protein B0H39_004655 [Clostridium beijerinckii]|uniref:HK97 gp10 family phage protein n=1 Tax=Clostridium beijerinckii TaxID=1520 RepID=UPI0014946181|nr:HK97 gp10 family phage protein [Clostridium beijerinckii]NOW86774.1 hypothetical protein [Clostridium beijerinckii]